MTIEDVKLLRERLIRDIRQFAESGNKIIERTGTVDSTALRAAANQFRQAAQTLDQLDGLELGLYYLRSKE